MGRVEIAVRSRQRWFMRNRAAVHAPPHRNVQLNVACGGRPPARSRRWLPPSQRNRVPSESGPCLRRMEPTAIPPERSGVDLQTLCWIQFRIGSHQPADWAPECSTGFAIKLFYGTIAASGRGACKSPIPVSRAAPDSAPLSGVIVGAGSRPDHACPSVRVLASDGMVS